MKLEKIKIFAEELGVEDLLANLFEAYDHIEGCYSFTKKGKRQDKEQYEPIFDKIKEQISHRLEIVIGDTFKGWNWIAGRLKRNKYNTIYYITLENPEWK